MEQEPYDAVKLESRLSGREPPTVRARIAARIARELKPGMRTEDIYRHAFDILRH